MGERSTIEGTVENVVFQNEENGYTVLSLLTDQGEVVTVVGCIPFAAAGESMTVTGVWVNHPTYGVQMTAELVERRMPQDEESIICYLASGVLKGVGPATATRLVDKFGADTLRIIEEEPEKLTILKGITSKKAMEISAAFRSLTGLRRVMEFLSRYDLPVTLAMGLLRAYGDETLEKLKDNPYLLTDERCGVDFSAADEIALAMGFDGDSPCRTEAAVLYELNHNLSNGHVFLPRPKLLAATMELIGVDGEAVEKALDDLCERGAIVCRPIANVQGCYLRRMYEAEVYVAKRLAAACGDAWDSGRNAEKIIDRIQTQQGIAYAPEQRRAVELAAERGVLLLTGQVLFPQPQLTHRVHDPGHIRAVFRDSGLHGLLLGSHQVAYRLTAGDFRKFQLQFHAFPVLSLFSLSQGYAGERRVIPGCRTSAAAGPADTGALSRSRSSWLLPPVL